MTKDKNGFSPKSTDQKQKRFLSKRICLISGAVTGAVLLFVVLLVCLHQKEDGRSGVQAIAPSSAARAETPAVTPAPSSAVPFSPSLATEAATAPAAASEASETPTAAPTASELPKTASASPAPTAATAPTATPVLTAAPAPTPTPYTGCHYPNQVPERAPVGWEYFEDAVFIGDSRMEDFAFFTGMAKYARFYTHIGVSVNQLVNPDPEKQTLFSVNGEKLTLKEALTKYNDFTKVYIMLGYNEVGWPYPEEFIKYYEQVLELIWSIRPDALIYVESVIPVARQISGSGVDPFYENNENIAIFNRNIYEMCEKRNAHFLNVQEALVDEEGYLPDGAASDGIHMGKAHCMLWLEYIKSHTVQS